MATTIPVPIEFSLPDGWQAAPPDEVGAPEAAFVALHPGSSQGFTANITLSGEVRGGDEPLTEIADQALRKLHDAASDVQLGRRNEVGEEPNPGLTQMVQMTVDLNGVARDIRQMQVFLAMADVNDPSVRAVLEVALTATPEQFDEVIGDFQKFLETLRPDQGQARRD